MRSRGSRRSSHGEYFSAIRSSCGSAWRHRRYQAEAAAFVGAPRRRHRGPSCVERTSTTTQAKTAPATELRRGLAGAGDTWCSGVAPRAALEVSAAFHLARQGPRVRPWRRRHCMRSSEHSVGPKPCSERWLGGIPGEQFRADFPSRLGFGASSRQRPTHTSGSTSGHWR